LAVVGSGSAAFAAISAGNAMRIIAGKFRSRRLRSLRGLEIRPTSDRLRETLFDVVTAGNPGALAGSVWLDLYAGTGTVGIEAVSRGAAMVYFVESSRRAAEIIHRNLRELGIESGVQVWLHDANAAIRELGGKLAQADFIFLDPPYRAQDAYRGTLLRLSELPLSETAVVIVEHEKKFDPGEKFGMLRKTRRIEQGDAALSFYRRG
jgi:16S rRNA (guanine(966)-N(2))-methyltransferase RsmD